MKMLSTGAARKDAAQKAMVMGLLQQLDRKKLAMKARKKSGVSASEMCMACTACVCGISECVCGDDGGGGGGGPTCWPDSCRTWPFPT